MRGYTGEERGTDEQVAHPRAYCVTALLPKEHPVNAANSPSARPGSNVACSLAHAARVRSDSEAVIDGAVRFDYAALERRVAGLGGGLLGLGLGVGDVVGVLALNSHRHLECWLGVPRVGLVLNELNTRLSVAELAFILDDSESRCPGGRRCIPRCGTRVGSAPPRRAKGPRG